MDVNFDTGLGEEAAPSRADAPELLGQWKSMPGGEGGALRLTLVAVIVALLASLIAAMMLLRGGAHRVEAEA